MAPVGPNGKGSVADSLELTDFIDDDGDALQDVYRGRHGNSGSRIEAVGGSLVHFSRSGQLRPPPSRPYLGSEVPACMFRESSWREVVRHFEAMLR